MKAFSLNSIVRNLNCNVIGLNSPYFGDYQFTGVSTDTRTLEPRQLFIALKGQNYDGHNYLHVAKQRGALAAVVQRNRQATDVQVGRDFLLIEVDDTLNAYGRIAEAHRAKIDGLRLVAITGSSGKTSTKDFISSIAEQVQPAKHTLGNYNNRIGVPKTLLELCGADQVAIIEMGMNTPGEIAQLAKMAHPQIAIITNIGHAHIEYLGSINSIAWEKSRLFATLPPEGVAITSSDEPFVNTLAAQTNATILTAGLINSGDVRAESIKQNVDGTRFDLIAFDREHYTVYLPSLGVHMVRNALLGFLAGHALGISPDICVQGLEQVKMSGSRMEMKSVAGICFISDCYNANPESSTAAIEALSAIPICKDGRRIAVFGHLGELGSHSTWAYKTIAELAVRCRLDLLVTVGESAKPISDFAIIQGHIEVAHFIDHDTAADFLASNCSTEDLILLKGSRSAHMEIILTKVHDIIVALT